MKRAILENLERRKRDKIGPCDSCSATGRISNKVCDQCLGQGVVLYYLEYHYILQIAGYDPSELDDDSILNQQFFLD